MKKITLFMMLGVFLVALAACNGDDDLNRREDENDEIELREFTLEELAQYDGEDGRDAYVAVDGYVYDMTDSAQWQEGMHQGRVQAGQDLTDEIDNESPHGRANLDRVPKIGIIVDD